MYAKGMKFPQKDQKGYRIAEAPHIRFEKYADEGTSPRATAAALTILRALMEKSLDECDDQGRLLKRESYSTKQ